MSWKERSALIAPYYSKSERVRKPVRLDIMLRVNFLQLGSAPSDPGVEDALYESAVLRRLEIIDPGRAPAPDETTILNFLHLLEAQKTCGQMLDVVNEYLAIRSSASPSESAWMRPSSMRRVRPRTLTSSAAQRCTTRKRATSGISGPSRTIGWIVRKVWCIRYEPVWPAYRMALHVRQKLRTSLTTKKHIEQHQNVSRAPKR